MLKPLGWLAIIGFALAAIFLASAFFTRDQFAPWRALDRLNVSCNDDGSYRGNFWRADRRRPCPGTRGPMGSKSWPLAGDTFDVEIAAEVRMVPGPGPTTIKVTGPQYLLDQLSFENGVLDGAEYPPGRGRPMLRVEINGGPIREYRMAVGSLRLGHVDQDRLSVHVEGAAEISGEGQVGDLNLSIEGAGENDLGHLKAQSATVHIEGAGHAEIAPLERADITIDGAGLVELATKPKNLSTHLTPIIAHVTGPDSDDHESDWENK